MIVFYGVAFVSVLAQPLLIALAFGVSMASRNWWHAFFGGVVAGGLAFIWVAPAVGRVPLFILFAVGGAFWSLLCFGLKRELRG